MVFLCCPYNTSVRLSRKKEGSFVVEEKLLKRKWVYDLVMNRKTRVSRAHQFHSQGPRQNIDKNIVFKYQPTGPIKIWDGGAWKSDGFFLWNLSIIGFVSWVCCDWKNTHCRLIKPCINVGPEPINTAEKKMWYATLGAWMTAVFQYRSATVVENSFLSVSLAWLPGKSS